MSMSNPTSERRVQSIPGGLGLQNKGGASLLFQLLKKKRKSEKYSLANRPSPALSYPLDSTAELLLARGGLVSNFHTFHRSARFPVYYFHYLLPSDSGAHKAMARILPRELRSAGKTPIFPEKQNKKKTKDQVRTKRTENTTTSGSIITNRLVGLLSTLFSISRRPPGPSTRPREVSEEVVPSRCGVRVENSSPSREPAGCGGNFKIVQKQSSHILQGPPKLNENNSSSQAARQAGRQAGGAKMPGESGLERLDPAGSRRLIYYRFLLSSLSTNKSNGRP